MSEKPLFFVGLVMLVGAFLAYGWIEDPKLKDAVADVPFYAGLVAMGTGAYRWRSKRRNSPKALAKRRNSPKALAKRREQAVVILAHRTGTKASDIERELTERKVTPSDWATEHGLDPLTFKPRQDPFPFGPQQ